MLDGLDGSEKFEGDMAWEAELDRRFEDIVSGRSIGSPTEEVMARLREKPVVLYRE